MPVNIASLEHYLDRVRPSLLCTAAARELLARIDGSGVFRRVADLSGPREVEEEINARRVLLVERDYSVRSPVVRAMTLGEADYHLCKPWMLEQDLYRGVSEFLADWARDQDAAFAGWAKALALPTVQGLVIGRSLLYPPGDDVAGAVDAAVGLR